MRTFRLRRSFASCLNLNRKVGDERPKRTLEMGDFPLQVLEFRRQERLAELKAECLDLKHQLSEHSLQAAIIQETQFENAAEDEPSTQTRTLSGRHSKSMHELSRGSKGDIGMGNSTTNSEDTMYKRREERLKDIRRELEQFAIKYSIGEYAENIDGIGSSTMKKAVSENPIVFPLSPVSPTVPNSSFGGSLQGMDSVNAAIVLRIQRQRELELQRARLELKHLAFRLKHKLDDENIPAENTA